ncbi:MAG TPA: efflux RND transporter periplasmic adaptor subunit [Bryobacteraceae bacterium]|jgi:multidrug efflux pump subunit AcrA (membrane-fusion protein)
MKPTLVVLMVAAAFLGGLELERWHAKPAAAGPAERKVLYWVDPMHPWYKSDKPGIAPDCGMKLVPMYAGEQLPNRVAANAVQVSPEKQQSIGVEYGTAEYETTADTIRAAARVTLDETKIVKVQTRLEGWIDRVFADFTGKYVKKGDPLATVYSPDALATQQEYLLALRAQHIMHDDAMPAMAAGNDNLVAAARKRLELWDISGPQIDEVGRTGKPIENLTVYAPASGYVTERNAFPKQHVTSDTVLYTLADLSSVWVLADVFEYEAAGVRLGQAATLTLDYLPGRTFYGRVSYILPGVDPASRTLKARIAFDNPGGLLKPDMYGQVEIHTGGARRLMAPESAVLDSGDRQVVYVDRGNGNLEPRPVRVGEHVGGKVEILAGLTAGERIVTSGNFLLDSESQLKAAGGGTAK